MKKKLIGLSLSAGILVSITLMNNLQANAAEVSKGSSTANFELQAGDSTTIPEVIDPELLPPTGNKGPLSLDTVSSFNFQTKKLGAESKALLEATPVLGTKLGLQVTDERGEDLGWNLKVSATPFKTEDDTLELKGAVMTIPEGALTTKEGVDPLLTPTAFKVALSPTPTSIMKASTTQGRSTWVNSFEAKGEKVTLAVPSGNKVATYSSTITWSLEDAP
ncbi:hypothetical protein CKN86_02925 [Carnobacterium divergens]|uniref:WxL domain-containing protein n=1 Tax=Carnobacterium divergens TaxID=2748 RepID=UPI000D475F69|nr:WxL domain-containing protein [Carnobacterium divergens]MCO6018971.1 WxL domain-containing protein [Carnobacterium divergens]TFI63719.1 hypothetical protein CKN62_02960 [Carnobacterium divergens]TFI90882.1 hypothetical protein CKN84_02960 [Carnobacterium divergens]TFJ05749.1 hypothetical protein CKN86_02925 [Carnobacterium divergens]TFJ07397.1 hypothetical protein CKN65_02965 [Carnobacterium divergens]